MSTLVIPVGCNIINHYSCAVLEYYAACSGNFSPTFRYNISGPSSRVNNP